MRKTFYILGAATLVIIVAAGIGVGMLIYKGNSLDTESKALVDRAVPAIAASWDKEQLLDRATPELRANVKPEDLRALLDAVSQLGPLVEYQGATGEANMSYMAGSGSSVTASYVANAKFGDGVVLPNREAQTVRAWLNYHPGIQVVARDRAGAYADGVRSGAPEAVQVTDRWHLLRNLNDALARALDRHHKDLRAAADTATVGLQDLKPTPDASLAPETEPHAPDQHSIRRDRFNEAITLHA